MVAPRDQHRIALIAACLVLACEDGGADAFCERLAERRCASIARCCEPSELPSTLTDPSTCVATVRAQCEAALAGLVRRGSVRLDEEAAAACVERAGACGAHLGAFCEEAGLGQVPSGEACTDRLECAGDATCLPTSGGPQSEGAVCVEPQAEGGPCDGPTRYCGPGLYCEASDLRCARSRGAGEPCAGSAECGAGTVCLEARCAQLREHGEPCGRAIECLGGLCADGRCASVCDGR